MIVEKAKEVIRMESQAVVELEERIDESFERAVDLILKCTGRIIVTGVGKSGLIGTKIAGTLSSTGTAAHFLHPADSIHGDLGIVRRDDVVLCISKSGNTDELNLLLAALKRLKIPIISFVGDVKSPLAQASDVVVDVSVKAEACPYDLAPTSSTTAALVMGDALAIALLHKRRFTQNDFALIHPGGSIGRRLLMQVKEVMYTGDYIPRVDENADFKEILIEMNSKRFGGTCVVGDNGTLTGIITDGDLKRLLEHEADFLKCRAKDIMSKSPKTVIPEDLASTALEKMKMYNIMQLVVIDENFTPVGMIHLHDLLKIGFS